MLRFSTATRRTFRPAFRTWFGTTLREVVSANCHLWGALVTDGKEWEIIKPREIGVLDRIGGGDSFVGGLLYGILKGWDVKKCTQFGWASGALATTMLTDCSAR